MEHRSGTVSSRRHLSKMAFLLVAAVGCDGSDPNGPSGSGARVSTQELAEAAFAALRSAAAEVDGQVATDFSAPLSVSGASGTASVTGDKTSTSSSSYSSSTTTRQTDITIAFSDFQSDAGVSVSGSVRWFDYYYSRTACSDITCASASDHSEALEGTSIEVTFEYDGKTYSDTINVDASSGSDSSSWDVEVTNSEGDRFSFTAY
jgi:hypothetical protein